MGIKNLPPLYRLILSNYVFNTLPELKLLESKGRTILTSLMMLLNINRQRGRFPLADLHKEFFQPNDKWVTALAACSPLSTRKTTGHFDKLQYTIMKALYVDRNTMTTVTPGMTNLASQRLNTFVDGIKLGVSTSSKKGRPRLTFHHNRIKFGADPRLDLRKDCFLLIKLMHNGLDSRGLHPRRLALGAKADEWAARICFQVTGRDKFGKELMYWPSNKGPKVARLVNEAIEWGKAAKSEQVKRALGES